MIEVDTSPHQIEIKSPNIAEAYMIVLWILAGLLVGSFSLLLTRTKPARYIIPSLLVGCTGALVGGLLSMAITPFTLGDFSIAGFMCALISASILLFGYHEMQAT